MQSEFQRTFLIMRPMDAMDSTSTGFCRMERKGNRGKLVFNVQGLQSEGELHAIVLTQDGVDKRVISCGEMRTDARGQGVLSFEVDNLPSSTAAGYQAMGIVDVSGDKVRLAMVGFFGKGKPLDRVAVENLSAHTLGVLSRQEVKQEVPKHKELLGTCKEDGKIVQEQQQIRANDPVNHTLPSHHALPVSQVESQELDLSKQNHQVKIGSLLPENIWSQPTADAGTSPALGLPEELHDTIWPEGALPLKELFERFDVVAPVTGALNEVFISIPMNGGMMGIDHYLLGVRIENATVVAIGYAIPGTMDNLPTGLIGYTWMDTPLGGYWLKWEPVQ